MPKLLNFPKAPRWRWPTIGHFAPGESLRVILALDPPATFLRQLTTPALRGAGPELQWRDPRDLIIPVLEIPAARSEAIEAIDARARAAAAESFCGRFRSLGVSSSEKEGLVFLALEDPEALWSRLLVRLSRDLSKDGFEVVAPPAPRIILAQGPPPEKALSTKELGSFHVHDLVIYHEAPTPKGVIFSTISYAALEEKPKTA